MSKEKGENDIIYSARCTSNLSNSTQNNNNTNINEKSITNRNNYRNISISNTQPPYKNNSIYVTKNYEKVNKYINRKKNASDLNNNTANLSNTATIHYRKIKTKSIVNKEKRKKETKNKNNSFIVNSKVQDEFLRNNKLCINETSSLNCSSRRYPKKIYHRNNSTETTSKYIRINKPSNIIKKIIMSNSKNNHQNKCPIRNSSKGLISNDSNSSYYYINNSKKFINNNNTYMNRTNNGFSFNGNAGVNFVNNINIYANSIRQDSRGNDKNNKKYSGNLSGSAKEVIANNNYISSYAKKKNACALNYRNPCTKDSHVNSSYYSHTGNNHNTKKNY